MTIWAVNIMESKAHVAEWVADRKLTVPVLLDADGVVTRAYGVRATPTVVVIARDGRWLGRSVGAREWDTEGRTLMDAVLARRP